jgi:hypothetical protein
VKSACDHPQHPVRIFHHIVVPEAQHTKTLGFQEGRPGRIAREIGRMLPAIHFDDQHVTIAQEIRDVAADRRLPAEFGMWQRFTQSARNKRFSASVMLRRKRLARATAPEGTVS